MGRFLEKTFPHIIAIIFTILWILYGCNLYRLNCFNIVLCFSIFVCYVLLSVIVILWRRFLSKPKTKNCKEAMDLGMPLINTYLSHMLYSWIFLFISCIANIILINNNYFIISFLNIWIFFIIDFVFCVIRNYYVFFLFARLSNIPDITLPESDAEKKYKEKFKNISQKM